jgi:opacity protein-like surface antigen
MKSSLKAGLASAMIAAVACATAPAQAGGFDPPAPRGGSVKDAPMAPPPVYRTAAGPCYFRGDVGYSWSRDPSVKWPVNNITRTWDTDPTAVGAVDHNDPIFTAVATFVDTTTYAGDAVNNTQLENTWFGGFGAGCGSGSRGLRGEVMFNVHGERKLDGEPQEFTITHVFPTDPNVDTPVDRDPLHTSIRTYTLMFNAYHDLGKFGSFVPYVGAGIGVAYNKMSDVYFTGNPLLVNRIHGNSDVSFAWSLMAGVGYQISERAVLDVGYRYLDMGKISSQRHDTAGFINPRVVVDDIAAHEFKIGLRYHFGGSDCCATLAHAPLK